MNLNINAPGSLEGSWCWSWTSVSSESWSVCISFSRASTCSDVDELVALGSKVEVLELETMYPDNA
jgi:hypothetical protein